MRERSTLATMEYDEPAGPTTRARGGAILRHLNLSCEGRSIRECLRNLVYHLLVVDWTREGHVLVPRPLVDAIDVATQKNALV